MIHHQLDILDNDNNIVRPLVLRVIDHIKYVTGINENAELIFPGLGDARAQYVDETTGRPTVKMATQEGLVIDVLTRFEETNWSGMAVHRPQHQPFFQDPQGHLTAKPVYQDIEAVATVTYVTHSQNEALRWRNAASRRVAQWGETQMHESSYHYLVPKWVWALAKHIYDLRERRAGYGLSFEQYVQQCLSSQAVQVSNQSGLATEIGIRETQAGIQGVFDFTIEPEPVDKNNDEGNWRVRFGYKFYFSIPTAVSVTHPLMVHNTLVEERFIPKNLLQYNNVAQRSSMATSAFMLFECDNALRQHIPELPTFYHPAFDRWKQDGHWRDYRMYGSFMIGYLQEGQTQLLDLNNLGNYALSGPTKTWMKDNVYKQLHIPGEQPFLISLYENEELLSHDTISIDENLIVSCTRPLDMRKRYRVVISIVMKITQVNPSAMFIMKDHPEFSCAFLQAINASTGDLNKFSPYLDLSALKSCVITAGPSRQDVFDNLIHMNTVMSGVIVTERTN